jgi:hypothetical protein
LVKLVVSLGIFRELCKSCLGKSRYVELRKIGVKIIDLLVVFNTIIDASDLLEQNGVESDDDGSGVEGS